MTALGVDIGGSGVRALASGGFTLSQSLPVDEDAALAQLTDALHGVAERAGGAVGSVAVVCGGHLSHDGRITHWPNRPGWVGVDLGALVRDTLGPEPVFEDDCAAAALAESREVEDDPLVYVGLGTGVGAGLVVGGRLMRGARGEAMEIGHLRVPSVTERCACGQTGCLQAVAGGRALRRELEGFGMGDDLAALEQGLAAGEPRVMGLASTVATAMREALHAVARLVDPACVVIGGGVVLAAPRLLAAITETAGDVCPIAPAKWGADASLRGALLLAENTG